MKLILVWLLNALALFLVTYLVPGVHLADFSSALVAVLILGLVNTILRPLFILLTLPVTLLTLGLFIFVINAGLFMFVGDVLRGFQVDGFGAALLGSIAYSVVSWLLSSVFRES